MDSVAEAIEKLAVYWWQEVEAAKRKDFGPMIESLRSDKAIPPGEERWLRDTIASALAGDFDRKRGRPPDPKTRALRIMGPNYALFLRNPEMGLAVYYVKRFVHIHRQLYGGVRGVEAEAIKRAVSKFGVNEDTLHNHLHRSPRRRAPSGRT